MRQVKYLAVIHKDEDSDFGISFPDFPGCVSAGTTIEETIEEGTNALHSHIQALIACGREIPNPRDFSTLFNSDWFEGGLVVPITYSAPAEVKRINITVREDYLDAIDRIASFVGKSRSAFIIESALLATKRIERSAKIDLVDENTLTKAVHSVKKIGEVVDLSKAREAK